MTLEEIDVASNKIKQQFSESEFIKRNIHCHSTIFCVYTYLLCIFVGLGLLLFADDKINHWIGLCMFCVGFAVHCIMMIITSKLRSEYRAVGGW